MTNPFWINEPNVLFKKDRITEIWPTSNMQFSEKLNAITRLVIAMTIIGSFSNNRRDIIITGIVTIVCIAFLYFFKKRKNKEGFKQANESPEDKVVSITDEHFTMPKKSNPIMNVLPQERADNPLRNPAAPSYNKKIEKSINDEVKEFVTSNFDDPSIKDKLFKDLGDSFGFDQSMRQWYSTANTQIPNDQKSFAEWCYGDMISCKEGNELACTRNAPHRWATG